MGGYYRTSDSQVPLRATFGGVGNKWAGDLHIGGLCCRLRVVKTMERYSFKRCTMVDLVVLVICVVVIPVWLNSREQS